MEEILASIRRIIADDQSFPDRATLVDDPVPVVAPAPASIHVLHSDADQVEHHGPIDGHDDPAQTRQEGGVDTMLAQGIVAAPQFASPTGPLAEPSPPDPADVPASPASAAPMPPEAPVSAEGRAFSHGSSDEPTVEDQRAEAAPVAPALVEAAPLFSAATNSSVASAFNVLAASRLADNSEDLLGLAREMIRPLLRSWLDENLPGMVERMVRDEIERVARGGH